jgi:hypothetical protein
MHNPNPPVTPRRSSRVPLAVPILVTSLEPATHFSGVCETLVVNAHGCAMRSPVRLQTGVALHFHSKEGRQATARVVSCQPLGVNGQGWRLGARLDRPDNFWGLQNCPNDWPALLATSALPETLPVAGRLAGHVPTPRGSASVPGNGVGQNKEEHITRVVVESVRALQAEVMAIKEKLAREERNRSRFEVSLSSIPPELEQQLELRLRKELGPRVLDEARQQSAQLLTAAKATIDQKTSEACQEFRGRIAEEFQVFEQRAQEMSGYISENIREHLRRGLGEFHERLVDGGNRLKQRSEELLEFLQQSLNEEHNGRCRELEQIRLAVASESARLQEQVEYLDSRIAKLYESACRLESGIEKRLTQMASDAVERARGELESAAKATFQEWITHSSEVVGHQTREASEELKNVEKEVVASVSEALKAQTVEALQTFDKSMEVTAKHSAERWRLALAARLNAAVKSLGE